MADISSFAQKFENETLFTALYRLRLPKHSTPPATSSYASVESAVEIAKQDDLVEYIDVGFLRAILEWVG